MSSNQATAAHRQPLARRAYWPLPQRTVSSLSDTTATRTGPHAADVARLWAARRDAEQEVVRCRDEVERAQREADWLRHAADELADLAPEPGEETGLAGRRTAMMQAEKIAEDLREAQAVVSGSGSAVPALAAAVRRLERRHAAAAGLIEPAVKAGTLVTTLKRFEPAPAPISLVYPSQRQLPLKVRAFLDFAGPRLRSRLAAPRSLQ